MKIIMAALSFLLCSIIAFSGEYGSYKWNHVNKLLSSFILIAVIRHLKKLQLVF